MAEVGRVSGAMRFHIEMRLELYFRDMEAPQMSSSAVSVNLTRFLTERREGGRGKVRDSSVSERDSPINNNRIRPKNSFPFSFPTRNVQAPNPNQSS